MNDAKRAHALSLGQLIDRVFRLIWAHLWVFVGIAFPPMAVTFVSLLLVAAVIVVPIVGRQPKPPEIGPLLYIGVPLFVLQTVVSVFVFGVYFAAGSHAALAANLGGKPTIRGAYRAARDRAGRYCLLAVLCYAATFLPALLLELTMFAVGARTVSTQSTPGLAVFFLFPVAVLLLQVALVYGVVMALRLSLAMPACVAEGLKATAAMRRSTQLVRGAMGRIFVVLLVVYAASYLLIMLVEAFGFAGGGIVLFLIGPSHLHALTAGMWVLVGVAGSFVLLALTLCTALTWAGIVSALAVIYHDQCFHLEGVWPGTPAGEPA